MRGRIPDSSLDGFRGRGDLAQNPMRRSGRRAEDGHHLAPAEGEARPPPPGGALGQRPDAQEELGGGTGQGGGDGGGGGRRGSGRRRISLHRKGPLCDFGAAVKIPGTQTFFEFSHRLHAK